MTEPDTALLVSSASARRRDWAVIILAAGLVTALNVVAIGLVVAALAGDTVIEGAVNVLIGLAGLVGGIVSSYLGFRIGRSATTS
jgi:hypothetical protein